jgi:hypothetical protein
MAKPVQGFVTVLQLEHPVYVAADTEGDGETRNGTMSATDSIKRLNTGRF